MEITAAVIGGIFVLLAALIPIILNKKKQEVKSIDTSSEVDRVSKYAVCRISDTSVQRKLLKTLVII
jgi:hypothetical protein